MKFIHTSDLHLNENNPERLFALKEIISLGKNRKADALLISGDLFDADIDALKLKAEMRRVFSGLPFDVYLIPGNHDSASFEDRAFFGSNVKTIRGINDIYDLGDAVICGIPFKNASERALYADIQNLSASLNPGKTNILLFHGELIDSFFSRSDFGEEGDSRYMPARLDMFRNLNFNYVLAGHFHTNFNVWEFDPNRGNGFFVYPGSPVSITKRETGKRKVNFFTCGEAPEEIFLDTEYFERITVRLDPVSDTDPATSIQNSLSDIDKKAKILLKIEGYLNSAKHGIDETSLSDFLSELKNKNANIIEYEYNAGDLKTIIEDPVYKTFMRRLSEKKFDVRLERDISDIFLKAMTEAGI